jgi:predicted RND superfamily exporter protein
MFADTAEVYVTGIPVISATVNEAMQSDLALLVPLVIIVVLLTLFFSFRRLSGVVLPLLAVVSAAVWSMGAMSLFNVRLSVISTVLPVILVAVGSAYGIHVITHYLAMGKPELDSRTLMLLVVKKIAKPVFLAALTTLAGFLSFCFTTVLPIREFGFFAGFGVVVSFVLALTLIPALLIIRGSTGRENAEQVSEQTAEIEREIENGVLDDSEKEDRFSIVISSFFTHVAARKGTVLFAAVLVMIFAAIGASRIIIDNVFIEYFKPDTDIAKSDRFVREQFGGSKIISIMISAETSQILLSPACLLAVENLNRHLEAKIPEVGKTMGFTDLVKRINQVFNVNESPRGLRAAVSSGPGKMQAGKAAEDFSAGLDFGFDENGTDFGFGNFGIDDAEEFGFGVFEKDVPAESLEEAPPAFTAEGLIALLSRAARSGSGTELSAGELVNELRKLVNFEGAAYYEVPANPAKYGKTRPEELAGLVSNYLILLSGSISSYANDPLEPTAIKTTVQLRALGESDTNRAVEAIKSFVDANFPGDVTVTVGGSALVEASLNREVVNSQLISLVVSLVLVFFIIAFSNHSAAAGLVGIVPISISIMINFAVMGFLGIKLNLGTSMIASLSIGIGIDYTIHYMESFKRENFYSAFTGGTLDTPGELDPGRLREFLMRTFAVSGKAIIINALSVGSGFAVLIFSQFIMLRDFGLLIALTMGVSSLVSLTVIPALLLAFKPAFVFTVHKEESRGINI